MNARSIVALLAFVLAVGAGYYFFNRTSPAVTPPLSQPVVVAPRMQQYSSEKYGIAFSYPNAYQLTELEAPGSAQREHHVITLMRKADLPPPEGGEGPPAITIDIYENDLDHLTTEGWIKNTSQSNFKLGDGNIASTTVSDKEALSYRWSGLYEGTTIALATQAWVYAFNVTYLEPGADIVQDFVAIRDSVRIR